MYQRKLFVLLNCSVEFIKAKDGYEYYYWYTKCKDFVFVKIIKKAIHNLQSISF